MAMVALNGKTILLVISGGIAAYKSLELIRLIRKAGGRARCVLTKGGAQFVTPLSISALCEEPVYSDLFSLKDETEMGHIRLSREADLIVVAPASANMIARMAHGFADDLASAVILAANQPVLLAPAMNHMMWENPATQDNIAKLQARGFLQIGPASGDMACNETGMGRMAEPEEIFGAILKALSPLLARSDEVACASTPTQLRCFGRIMGRGLDEGQIKPEGLKNLNAPHPYPLPTGERELTGLRALVTSGPTYEPLDPVRFIGNRSSGKQGHAIAAALAERGADVTLISGPVTIADPPGVKTVHVETAVEMLDACRKALPADIAVCAAAVSDWSAAAVSSQKIKKKGDRNPPDIKLKENPDILAALAGLNARKRPGLVIGFAAETENLLEAAAQKRLAKGCDWIVANKVGGPEKVFGSDENHVYLVTGAGSEDWRKSSKQAVAGRLAEYIAVHFAGKNPKTVMAAE